MHKYRYAIIWLNKIGEEQIKYVITERERNTIIQDLANDGYSPVWRTVELFLKKGPLI
ncbi:MULTISPECIES: hypothetical protein [Bacillus]|uniref:Uncharacterized protein n=1 Tax=Bacillus cereus (strain G9842) TaxID=405531 RepID=B7IZP8_BACC2|nr:MULTISPECIES: hypothetical protein [Bacillus]ACK98742.1 hypothetical protein BCG9842_A0055 [Bacillus cereus G9842]MEB9378767.1 hypothetical protein [Bacillus cereus]WLP67151.1 hypothetical protein Q9G86_28290 [Bacillus thuringiensis]HDR8240471.1 hypothetical protein [Bacillus cereus]